MPAALVLRFRGMAPACLVRAQFRHGARGRAEIGQLNQGRILGFLRFGRLNCAAISEFGGEIGPPQGRSPRLHWVRFVDFAV
jgi:hypothetical protein